MRTRFGFAVLAILLCAGAWLAVPTVAKSARPEEAVAPAELVSAQRGTLPIILSAPHGGSIRVEGSKDREEGVTVKDLRTAEIAWLTSQRLAEKLDGKVYLVIAQFSRKDADANRSADEACENKAAAAQYNAYHRALREYADEVRKAHGRGLLVDIHGQAKHPDKIMRGTRDGKSVKALLDEYGESVVTGDHSLFGELAKQGYGVLPALDGKDLKENMFDGGYITEHYGSHHKNGIDAIQVEIGSKFRSKAAMHKTAEDLGDAIAAFARQYILKK
jgi:N-formylglutamate amidohydrolase